MIETAILTTWVILVREGLEAILIISIISAYLIKSKIENGRIYVAIGVLGALLLSLLIGAVIFLVKFALVGIYEKLFEGIVSITAAIILTYVVLWMVDNAKTIKQSIETNISEKLQNNNKTGIILVAFFAVFREGLETVLFLSPLLNVNIIGLTIGLLLGFSSLAILAFLILKYSIKFPLRKFFKYTSIILIVIAAGILSYGVHELIEVLELTGFELGILAIPVWDTSSILNEASLLGQFMMGLIGYDANPELLRLLIYLTYWMLVIIIIRNRTDGKGPKKFRKKVLD